MPESSPAPAAAPDLISRFRGIVCDLDGVVYLGPTPVPHAVAALTRAIHDGVTLVFATNSAARTPADVAAHLRRLGVPADERNVVTSAQAGAGHLASSLAAGAPVLAVGGPGVAAALREAGLTAVDRIEARNDPPVQAVLQGLGTEVSWNDLAEVAVTVRRGAAWVATNRDLTVPTDRGLCPGNGALVGAVAPAAGTTPLVTGKPEPAMYQLCVTRLGLGEAAAVLAIGDRLDTDIAGANRSGLACLHVLTGVTTVADLVLADDPYRPTFLAGDLRALHRPYVPAVVTASGDLAGDEGPRVRAAAQCGAARVIVLHDGEVRCSDDGGASDNTDLEVAAGRADHRLRAIVAAAWTARDGGWLPSEAALEAVTGWYDEARQAGRDD